MSEPYDNFDYPSYWKGREYEYGAELMAINSFLKNINKSGCTLDIGAGYGRITKVILDKSKEVILSDPSQSLLSLAKKRFSNKKIRFIKSSLENLPKKLKSKKCNLLVMVRVLHHISNLDVAFKSIDKLTKGGSYIIFEFANKNHFKAKVLEFFKGNFIFPFEILPKDLASNCKGSWDNLPFKNYHPDQMFEILKKYNFIVIEGRSVSNIRSGFLKGFIPLGVLLLIESCTQRALFKFNFGPSIFILAKKV